MSTCIDDYQHADWSYYRFKPSVEANVVFLVLFGISSLLHGFQIWRTKTWYLSALVIGGCSETIGYIGRLLGAMQDPGCWTMGPFIMQSLLILIAPALMAASIYMILGRIIELTEGEHFSLVRKRWLTKIFVMGDVMSLLLQASGGGMMAINHDIGQIGEKIIVVGLFVQLLFFGSFIAVASVFHRRMAAAPTPQANDPRVRWRQYLTTLYVTGTLILIRSIFRVIEFIQGNDGVLMRSEVYVFVFDGLLMLVVLAWMNWFHPGEIGLLLRGDAPIKNGLELVKRGRGKRYRSETIESLSSEQSPTPRNGEP
ncbi:RTA1 like protein-domain-containing protein [Dactylonectria estremocensis]|uniref:RTA1 like protein-domain-containing protein n=1 Tax=Dactylonectria estremocensis TaxID=1079267 RepID=A0A9P9IT22_9HYPO|nr:RTA1 like protein-domain-containing protein [Dactylonectria estremocensis]